MKKKITAIAAVLAAVTVLLMMTSCQKKSYGDLLEHSEELVSLLNENSLSFRYPGYLGEAEENTKKQYIAVKDFTQEVYTGYKIYQFGAPFFTCVTAYSRESDMLESDDSSRMEYITTLSGTAGDITVYSGKGHKDALFLIGCFNLDGCHYEIRVTADEDMQNGVYTHAIYTDNEYYPLALDVMVKIADSLQ